MKKCEGCKFSKTRQIESLDIALCDECIVFVADHLDEILKKIKK